MSQLRSIHLFFALLAALFAGCQSMQGMIGGAPKPTAHVIGASIRGLSLDNSVLLFDVEVQNPYPASLPLIDLRYTLTSSGVKFAEGALQPTGSIPAQGRQVIQLPVTVAFSSLFAALKGVKPGALVSYTADFRIGVDTPVVGRIDVPLSKSGELPVPAVPHVELSDLAIGKLNIDQTRASAKLKIKNTNQFALDISKLVVYFSLGGQEVGSGKLASPLSLGTGQTTMLEIPLSFSPRTVGVGIVNLLKGDQIAYQIAGSMDANTRFGPLSMPFSRIGNTAVTR